MGIGTSIRHRLGPWEVPAASLYRSVFIRLEDLATTLASLAPARRILEIGCGDGALADHLLAVYPEAAYLGIDIAPGPGRLFQGDRSRSTFRSVATGDLLAEGPDTFDLVVVVDVVHHVPVPQRDRLLRDAAELTAPGGVVAVKEWERGRNVAHAITYAADRYVSGDTGVDFPGLDELRRTVASGLPGFELVCETRIPPHRNNVLLTLRRSPERSRAPAPRPGGGPGTTTLRAL